MFEVAEELGEFVHHGYLTAVLGKIKEGKDGEKGKEGEKGKKGKKGKEAEACLCEGGERTGEAFLAAKVHRAVARRRLRDDAVYREGRVVASRTIAEAIERRSRFGQEMMGATWLLDEYSNLRAMEAAGVPVPRLWARTGRALLLTFLGSADGEGTAAPRPAPDQRRGVGAVARARRAVAAAPRGQPGARRPVAVQRAGRGARPT